MFRGFEVENGSEFQDIIQTIEPDLCDEYRGTSPRRLIPGTKVCSLQYCKVHNSYKIQLRVTLRIVVSFCSTYFLPLSYHLLSQFPNTLRCPSFPVLHHVYSSVVLKPPRVKEEKRACAISARYGKTWNQRLRKNLKRKE